MSKSLLYILLLTLFSTCTYPENDQRISELEKELNDLQEQLDREQRLKAQAQNKKDLQTKKQESQDKGDSEADQPRYILNDARGLLDPPYLRPELNVRIVESSIRSDAQFNQYLLLTVRNEYSKPVRSLRFRSRVRDEFEFQRNRRVNLHQDFEIVTVSLAPGQSTQIAVRKIGFGPYIEAVNFADGLSHHRR